MPMFQQATDFTLDGTFQDVNGDQHNNNHSLNVQGNNNQTTFSPNHSRAENHISNNVRGVNIQGIVAPGGHNYIGVQHQSFSPPHMNREQYPVDLLVAFLSANPQLQATLNGGLPPPCLQQGPIPHDAQQALPSQPPLPPYQPLSPTNYQNLPEFSLPRHSPTPPRANELVTPSPQHVCSPTPVIPPTPTPTTPISSENRLSTSPSSDTEMNLIAAFSTTTPRDIPVANTSLPLETPASLPTSSNPAEIHKNAAALPFLSGHEPNMPDGGTLQEGGSFPLFQTPDSSKRDSLYGISSTEQGLKTRGTSWIMTKVRWWLEKFGLKKVKIQEDTSFS